LIEEPKGATAIEQGDINSVELENASGKSVGLKVTKQDNGLKVTLKQAIIANIIVGPIALAIYFPLTYLGSFRILKSEYYFHALLTFICFAIVPLIYLIIFQIKTGRAKYLFFGTKKGFSRRNIFDSFFQGIVMHWGIFFTWVLIAQKTVPGVFTLVYFLSTPKDWFWQILFVTLNVSMFEFYSKAFIQIQLAEATKTTKPIKLFKGKMTLERGKSIGFIVQFIVWMGGHWLEFTWLPNYMGLWNAIFFIVVSGLITGYTVYKTENILGVTIGHVMLNVFLMIAFAH